MSATYEEATDKIKQLFWFRWRALTPALNGGDVIPVRWDAKDEVKAPVVTKPFARHSLKHGTSRQMTFGPPGQRRFERPGVVTVQVFIPQTNTEGLTLAEKCAIIARDAYEGVGTPEGIWFRNARIQEVGPDGTWLQYNMTSDFLYDELR